MEQMIDTHPVMFVFCLSFVNILVMSFYCEIRDCVKQIKSLDIPLDGMLPYGVKV